MTATTTLFRNQRRVSRAATGAFTLIELIIAIALLLIVMLMVMSMFRSAQDLYRIASQRADVFSQGRTAMDMIEADLQKIAGSDQFGDMFVCSAANETDPANIADYDDPFIQQSPDKDKDSWRPDNETTAKLVPLLCFKTTTSWTTSDGKIHTGLAQVSYYIKRRPPRPEADGEIVQPNTGYLVRYVIPVVTDYGMTDKEREESKIGRVEGAQQEVAASVLDMKIWAMNNGAAAYMGQRHRAYELFPRCDRNPSSSARLLRDEVNPQDKKDQDKQKAQDRDVTGLDKNRLKEVDKRPGITFGFGTQYGSQTQYVKTRGKYPLAIAVEITFGNDGMTSGAKGTAVEREVNGTLRVVRRIISIPNTEAFSSLDTRDLKRFDDTAGNSN